MIPDQVRDHALAREQDATSLFGDAASTSPDHAAKTKPAPPGWSRLFADEGGADKRTPLA
jgi:hypothetical protein